MRPTAAPISTKHTAAGLTIVALAPWFASCHGSDRALDVAAPPAPPAQPAVQVPSRTAAWDGHFVGWLIIGQSRYDAEALLTVDGAMRLLVHGPWATFGAGVRPAEKTASAMFVGTFFVAGDMASGGGDILGHPCGSPDAHEFCGLVEPALLSISIGTRELFAGRLVFGPHQNPVTWSFELGWVNDNDSDASLDAIEGVYRSDSADLAPTTDVVITIDGNGALFFQSADTGCVGNGWLVPHADGALNVYDASLTVANCAPAFAHLTGAFEGLATATSIHSGFYCYSYYDNCDGMTLWLSSPAGTPEPRALTLQLGPP
jgi:hypothetical protein